MYEPEFLPGFVVKRNDRLFTFIIKEKVRN